MESWQKHRYASICQIDMNQLLDYNVQVVIQAIKCLNFAPDIEYLVSST